MVFEGNIQVHSMCSHHHLPFFGVAHVAYIAKPEGKIIGLSKLNRTVEFYSRRPQVQENLTMQIHKHIERVCENTLGVGVMVEANHMCACVRGGSSVRWWVGVVSLVRVSRECGGRAEACRFACRTG